MNFNLITNLESCTNLIRDYVPINTILYSHVPASLVALFIGLFVLIKNRKPLVSKTLFSLSIVFSLWCLLDLVTWISVDSRLTSFSWALIYLFEALVFFISLYLVYVFVEKKDISLIKKSIMGFLLLPFIFLTPSIFNVNKFDVINCEAVQGKNIYYYLYFIEVLLSIWIIAILIKNYRKAEKEFKKQIAYFGIGILFFLLAFSWANIVGNITTDWKITQYGLFGMPIFIGFLAYLIVKFKAFNIKLLGAQALVVALVALIGSEFFFTSFDNTTNIILISVTVLLSVVFGIFLIESVKNEVKRKEELQEMSDKLALANDQLIKLDNAKSEFISIASHQLRTPLTAIKGFASLLLEGTYGKIEPKVRDALNKVYLSNERMVELVENLLNISRIESGRMEYQYQKWKVEDILHELYDTFFIMSKNKGLELKMNLPKEPLPEVEIDGPKTKEVISNLIDNAIKYSDHGSVSVTAELSKFPISNFPASPAGGQFPMKSQIPNSKSEIFEGNFVRISVIDTGIGIPKEELPYLFNKFSRGKDQNRLHVTGTGLGLYVGKQMIEAQHGKMTIQSEGAGKGSTFIVELPISQEEYRREERVEEFLKEV